VTASVSPPRPHFEDLDDATLVAAAQGGDRAALDHLLRRHVDFVHAVCARLVGNPTDAADATQEALIAIARGIARFDGRSAVRTWMYRVATNACFDELRRRGRRPAPGLPEQVADRSPDRPSMASSVTDRLVLDDALGALAEDFRAAVVLRDVLGMDYADIASTLGVPIGTVRSRIARGRAALAEHLGGNRTPPTRRPNPE
jgi:RNA polymerase sigma-70 factor (ECF subfamily)